MYTLLDVNINSIKITKFIVMSPADDHININIELINEECKFKRTIQGSWQ
jgi:hypothetical protein